MAFSAPRIYPLIFDYSNYLEFKFKQLPTKLEILGPLPYEGSHYINVMFKVRTQHNTVGSL